MYPEISSSNETIWYYRTVSSEFRRLAVDKYIRFVQSVIRDYLLLVIIFTMNIIILVSIRRAMKKKSELFELTKNVGNVRQMLTRTNRAKQKAKIMVLLTSTIYILGHIPISIFYLPFIDSTNPTWICFYYISWIPYYISYSLTFFIYIKFNNLFKAHFCRSVLNLARFLRLK